MCRARPLQAALLVAVTIASAWMLALQPGKAAGPPDFTSISAGGFHACGIASGAGVVCWGRNSEGALGDGTTSWSTLPVPVTGLEQEASSIISLGGASTCARTDSGGAMCWGNNNRGQLGNGTTDDSSVPVDVSGLTTGVDSIEAGTNHACAALSTGGLKCWGLNDFGQVGDGTTDDRSAPVDVTTLTSGVTAFSGGNEHTCAVTDAGAAKCWGLNGSGQLGDGTVNDSSVPVDVSGLTSGIFQISAGGFHTCALTESGAVKCWGYNGDGQLGDGTNATSSVPTDVAGLASGVVSVSAGRDHTCALTEAGGVKCWGDGTYGKLGDGSTMDRNTPIDVSGLTSDVTAISLGDQHSCALMASGRAKCWGHGFFGQLTNGFYGSLTPVDVQFDVDSDGCRDFKEEGPDETIGGLRSSKNYWDFYDTPDEFNIRDRAVAGTDFFRVLARFGATGDSNIDPHSAPPPAPAYHPAFDRGPSSGPYPWSLTMADGSITGTDFFALLVQFGHSCQVV